MSCTDYSSVVFDNGVGVVESSRPRSNIYILVILERSIGRLSLFVLLNLWRHCSDASSKVRAIAGALDKVAN